METSYFIAVGNKIMPYSSKQGKRTSCNWIAEVSENIKHVVDVGPGSGTYINLLKYKRKILKNAKWSAIEVWEPYINYYNLREKYDNIIIEDVRFIDWNIFSDVDLVILGDILEHITKEDAIILIDKLVSISKYVLLSIPIIHYPQEEEFGNPYEKHVKDDWSNEEITCTFGKYIKKYEIDSIIGIYWLEK